MKIEHDIIKDLIPLYVDGTLSDASRKAVEEHLEACPECREYLKEVQAAVKDLDEGNIKKDFQAEARTLKKAKKTIKKKKVLTIAISVIAALAAARIIGNVVMQHMQSIKLPMTDTDQMSVHYDDSGDLMVDVKGPAVFQTVYTLDLSDENGELAECVVFSLETTKWEQMHSSSNELRTMPLKFADEGASEIDRVYYLVPEVGSEDVQFDSLSSLASTVQLTDATLLYVNSGKAENQK